jgi:RAB6A-GEF complex partner protein 1
LVYFGHALEVLLHSIIEADDDRVANEGVDDDAVLQAAIDFLDHFDESLEVVVGCARKTEMVRWERLFAVVGKPRTLFQVMNNNLSAEHLTSV